MRCNAARATSIRLNANILYAQIRRFFLFIVKIRWYCARACVGVAYVYNLLTNVKIYLAFYNEKLLCDSEGKGQGEKEGLSDIASCNTSAEFLFINISTFYVLHNRQTLCRHQRYLL